MWSLSDPLPGLSATRKYSWGRYRTCLSLGVHSRTRLLSADASKAGALPGAFWHSWHSSTGLESLNLTSIGFTRIFTKKIKTSALSVVCGISLPKSPPQLYRSYTDGPVLGRARLSHSYSQVPASDLIGNNSHGTPRHRCIIVCEVDSFPNFAAKVN